MIAFFLESIRRLCTALLLFAGTICFWYLDGPWITIQLVDFGEELKNSPYFVSKDTTVDSFREQRTQGRTVETQSEKWLLLAQHLAAGALPDALYHMDQGRGRVAWVILPDALPSTERGEVEPNSYVHLSRQNIWLWVEQRTAREIEDLPVSMRNPLRTQAWLLLLAAIVVYVVLPRRKPATDEFNYSRAAAVVVPDWLGFLMSAFFLSLGMLVLNDNQPSFDGGWLWFAGIIALMSLLFLILPGIATYYATWHLRILDSGLAITQWGIERQTSWDKIASAAPYQGKANWVIGLLLTLAARGPGMAGQGLLVMTNQEQGIELQLTSGKKVRIMANAFPGFESVTEILQKHGLTNGAGK